MDRIKSSEQTMRIHAYITIALSIIEISLYLFLKNKTDFTLFERLLISFGLQSKDVNSILSLVTPAGIIFIFNYYVISPIVYKIGVLALWKLKRTELLAKKLSIIENDCLNFLVNCNVLWGVRQNDTVIQNANLCEGLIAITVCEKSTTYASAFDRAMKSLMNSITDNGLISKSLSFETTTCTAMSVYLLTIKSNYDIRNERLISLLLSKLWGVRNNFGWGLYVMKHSDDKTRFGSSFWVLRAFINSGKSSEFIGFDEFLYSFYERRRGSNFGYSDYDADRVCITAMFIILYYEMPQKLRNSISKVYNVKESIDFIIKETIQNKCYIELEQIEGSEERKGIKIKKIPWTHISIGYVLEAVGHAYVSKDITKYTMSRIADELIEITQENITYIPKLKRCYFLPNSIKTGESDVLTFPTAYFLIGIHTFSKLCLKEGKTRHENVDFV